MTHARYGKYSYETRASGVDDNDERKGFRALLGTVHAGAIAGSNQNFVQVLFSPSGALRQTRSALNKCSDRPHVAGCGPQDGALVIDPEEASMQLILGNAEG